MGADKLAENTKIPGKISTQFVCPSPKVWDSDEKWLYQPSVIRVLYHEQHERRNCCTLLNLHTKPLKLTIDYLLFFIK